MSNCKYRVFINTNRLDYEGDEPVEIAKLVDETDTDVLYVYYSKKDWLETGLHIRVQINEYEDLGEVPGVYLDSRYRQFLYANTDVMLGVFLHELGHFVNGHLTGGRDTEQIKRERFEALMKGKVDEDELEADRFAVEQIGKNKFMRSLDFLIKQRRERNDVGMDLAIKEFELRKKAVQKM